MHKSIGLIALFLLSNSVLAPTQANAATAPLSVSTSTEAVAGMTTTNEVQELPTAPLASSTAYTVTLTSYNAVPEQTSPTPWMTASGAPSNAEVIAARSHDLAQKLPYGTIIAVLGPTSSYSGPFCGYKSVQHLIGYRVIADSMNARMHNKVDVQLDQHDTVPFKGLQLNPAIVLGACTGVKIQVVGYVNPQHIPKTQTALAALVDGSNNLAYSKF
ncbi:hypothetical protein H0X32_03030 [Patescibacteria group bacterium]|nr:hypothetical protein [Patescibacteria group bacterium]